MFELQEKLKRHSDSAKDIENAISWAVDEGLVDNVRFAESRVMHRWYRGSGPMKIQAELHIHHISKDAIQSEIEKYDWQVALMKSHEKCRYAAGSVQWKRTMLSRGFRYDDIELWLKQNEHNS